MCCHVLLVQTAIKLCWMIVIGKDHVVFRLKRQNKLLKLHLSLHCKANNPTPGSSPCSVPVVAPV